MIRSLKPLATLSVLAILGACQSQRPAPPPVTPAVEEPLTWGRKDCQRAAGNASIQDQFARDKAFCEQDAQIGPGDGVNALMATCMNRRGYNYSTRTNHDAYCGTRTARR